MAFNLNEFRAKLANGGARSTQFEMQISWPDAVRGAANVSTAERDFRFLCQMSEIPDDTITVINAPYFGRKLKYAGDRTFKDLQVTIINDEDFKVRRALEVWMAAMQQHSSTISQFSGGIASGSYVTDGIVVQHSPHSGGSPIQAYKFVGMFPSVLSNIKLDWEGGHDSFETFTCDFAYQWWEAIDPTTGAAALGV